MFALWYLSFAIDQIRKLLGWAPLFENTANQKAIDNGENMQEDVVPSKPKNDEIKEKKPVDIPTKVDVIPKKPIEDLKPKVEPLKPAIIPPPVVKKPTPSPEPEVKPPTGRPTIVPPPIKPKGSDQNPKSKPEIPKSPDMKSFPKPVELISTKTPEPSDDNGNSNSSSMLLDIDAGFEIVNNDGISDKNKIKSTTSSFIDGESLKLDKKNLDKRYLLTCPLNYE